MTPSPEQLARYRQEAKSLKSFFDSHGELPWSEAVSLVCERFEQCCTALLSAQREGEELRKVIATRWYELRDFKSSFESQLLTERERLAKYGRHFDSCVTYGGQYFKNNGKCSCGFTEGV